MTSTSFCLLEGSGRDAGAEFLVLLQAKTASPKEGSPVKDAARPGSGLGAPGGGRKPPGPRPTPPKDLQTKKPAAAAQDKKPAEKKAVTPSKVPYNVILGLIHVHWEATRDTTRTNGARSHSDAWRIACCL